MIPWQIFNIRIVEDATESLGTFYLEGSNRTCHTGTIGDIGCFSFNGNKIITTGGGGMIVTNDDHFAAKARYLTTQAKDDTIRYIHNDIGYNYRLSNIQAAIGVAQLEQISEFCSIKEKNYSKYKSMIQSINGLSLADTPPYAANNHWMYALQIDTNNYPRSRESLLTYLMNKEIQTRPVWRLNHTQKPYANCFHYHIEKAIQLYQVSLNIPCSVNLTEDNINYVVEALQNG